MRACKNCNSKMIESDKIYSTSYVTGGSISYGTKLVVTKEQTKLRKKLNIPASNDPDFECNLQTAVCPTCGLVENYLSQEELINFTQYVKTRKDFPQL